MSKLKYVCLPLCGCYWPRICPYMVSAKQWLFFSTLSHTYFYFFWIWKTSPLPLKLLFITDHHLLSYLGGEPKRGPFRGHLSLCFGQKSCWRDDRWPMLFPPAEWNQLQAQGIGNSILIWMNFVTIVDQISRRSNYFEISRNGVEYSKTHKHTHTFDYRINIKWSLVKHILRPECDIIF